MEVNEIEVTERAKRRPIQYVISESGCWNCTSHCRNSDGYSMIKSYGKEIGIHRYMYRKYFGEIPEGLVIRHKCDNPNCINPNHLEIGTIQDNVDDRVKRGRQSHLGSKGEKNGRAKLTQLQVDEIRKDNRANLIICSEYKVALTQIYSIKSFKSWRV